MSLFDLITGHDGKIVLTKLAAATFHLLLALTVAFITLLERKFIVDMWLLYMSAAIGHAVTDKTVSKFQAYRSKKAELDAARAHDVPGDQPEKQNGAQG